MGSVPPKVNLMDQLQKSVVIVEHAVALFCPAQSFPVPAYRYFESYYKNKTTFYFNIRAD